MDKYYGMKKVEVKLTENCSVKTIAKRMPLLHKRFFNAVFLFVTAVALIACFAFVDDEISKNVAFIIGAGVKK